MPTNPASIFGRRLRAARLQAGIPQDRLGVLIGLDEGTASARMSRYESGVHEPAYETAVAIARELNVPTAYLFCDDDDLATVILKWGNLSSAEKKKLKSELNI